MQVKDLKFDKRNYRKHNKRNLDLIKKSVNEVGFGRSIVINSDNEIICGNGISSTLEKDAKLKVIETDGTELIVVKRNDLKTGDIKQTKLGILDNSTSDSSEFDFELLQADFDTEELEDWGIDLEIPELEEEKEVIEDEVPEEVETRCKLGDIWQLGEHRLMCGDSTKVDDVEKLMNGEKADMVFTDPPYGYEYQSNERIKSEKFDVIKNDDKILNFFPCLKKVCFGFIYICTSWKTVDKWIDLFKKHYDLTNVIIWDKGGGGIGDLFHTFATDYEMILVCNNNKELKGKRYGSVWNFSNTEISKMKKEELLEIILEQKKYYSIWKQKKDNSNEYIHPTQKPVALSARAIRSSTEFGEVCLDLFGGSGSTLIACEQLNRKCYTMELDEKYCDVILQRWENLTGKKAELING